MRYAKKRDEDTDWKLGEMLNDAEVKERILRVRKGAAPPPRETRKMTKVDADLLAQATREPQGAANALARLSPRMPSSVVSKGTPKADAEALGLAPTEPKLERPAKAGAVDSQSRAPATTPTAATSPKPARTAREAPAPATKPERAAPSRALVPTLPEVAKPNATLISPSLPPVGARAVVVARPPVVTHAASASASALASASAPAAQKPNATLISPTLPPNASKAPKAAPVVSPIAPKLPPNLPNVVIASAPPAAPVRSMPPPLPAGAAVRSMPPPLPAAITDGRSMPPPLPAAITGGRSMPPPLPATVPPAPVRRAAVPPPLPIAFTGGAGTTTPLLSLANADEPYIDVQNNWLFHPAEFPEPTQATLTPPQHTMGPGPNCSLAPGVATHSLVAREPDPFTVMPPAHFASLPPRA